MVFYALAGLLLAFLAVDWAITRSSRRRDEWAFWENWNFFVYGPCFVLICLAMTVTMWFQPDWSARARYPILLGLPVVVVFFAAHWYRYFGRRLRALLAPNRSAGGPGGGEGPADPR